MGTVINTNVSALNSVRSLKVVGGKTAKASEKLSSGLRINRAGDDAAGLAISEKMRSQIKGLNQASRNSQDGISLIQTAEGALQESHDMLQRMRELVVQGSNGTNTKEDREKIALELNELSDELTSISDKTEFNKKKLINGDLASDKLSLQTGANENQTMDFAVGKMNADALGVSKSQIGAVVASGGGTVEGTFTGTAALVTAAKTISLSAALTAADGGTYDFGGGQKISIDKKAGITISGFGEDDGVYTKEEFKSKYVSSKDFYATTGAKVTIAAGGANIKIANIAAGSADATKNISAAGDITAADTDAPKTSALYGIAGATITGHTAKTGAVALEKISFSGIERSQVSGVSDDIINKITSGESIDKALLLSAVITSKDGKNTQKFDAAGATTFKQKAITVKHSADAAAPSGGAMGKVLEKVDNAIATVSEQRAKLGAYQNRLEHTINNLDTSSENLSAAESRVRDTDLAKEMIEFTKSNVLSQAAQSMLAQANQAPNQVLQLLG